MLLLKDALPFERGGWSLRSKLSQQQRCTQQGLGGAELQRYLTPLFRQKELPCPLGLLLLKSIYIVTLTGQDKKNGPEPFLPLGYKNWDSSYIPKHYLTICHTGNPRKDTHNVLKDWLWLQCEKNEMWKESGKCTWKQTLALGLPAPKQHSSVKK